MKGFLRDGLASGQAFEVGDPPLRRGIVVLGDAGFGEEAHRYYLCEIDGSGAIYMHAGEVRWPPEAGPPVRKGSFAEMNDGDG